MLCRGRQSRLCSLHVASIAFCHALLDEDIRVGLPKGEEDEHGVVWQLKKALYGTRRVALLFQEYVIQGMVKIGFTVVRVAAQTFYHAAWLVLATVHGNDFMGSGETQSLDMLDEALEQFFVLKKMPKIGPPEFRGSSESSEDPSKNSSRREQRAGVLTDFTVRRTNLMVRRLCGTVFLTSEKRREG